MRRLTVGILALAAAASVAHAHGGLPISEQIVFQGDQLVVPTRYWGVFFGTDGGPWRWICEEAINKDQGRVWALQGNGTYHVTDYMGVTSSRDGGCTWVQSTGDIASRATSFVVADPADPKRAWATTTAGTSDAPWNALFTTVDDGVTWTPVLMADEYLNGVALSPDGMTIYVTGWARVTGPVMANLHVSKDGGQTWATTPITYMLTGLTPSQLQPIAVDPSDPSVCYLRAIVEPVAALVKLSSYGASESEEFQVMGKTLGGMMTAGSIGDMAFDAMQQTVTVATSNGLERSTAGAAFMPLGNLSQTQCVAAQGTKLYACSWNYAPDNAAIARSDDGGQHFTKVFQYADTVGPTTSCAPSTPVGTICPQVWAMYATQLGINLGGDDGGTSDMTPAPAPGGGCSCDAGGGWSTGQKWGVGVCGTLLLVTFLLVRGNLRRKKPAGRIKPRGRVRKA